MEKKELQFTSEFSDDDGKTLNGHATNGVLLSPKELEISQSNLPEKVKTENEDEGIPRKGTSLRLTIFGFSCGVIGSLLVATGTSCAQALQGAVPDFELAAMRGFFQWFLAGIFLTVDRRLPKVAKKHIFWVFLYAMFTTAFNITNYLAINYIAVGIASCVRRTLSLFLVTILARLILKERITVVKLLSVAVSVVGVILLIQPWYDRSQLEEATLQMFGGGFISEKNHHNNFLLDKLEILLFNPKTVIEIDEVNLMSIATNSTNSTMIPTTTDTPLDGSDVSDEILGYVLAICAGCGVTLGSITHKARCTKYNSLILNFYAGALIMTTSLVLSLSTEDLTFPSDGDERGLVIGQSICSGVAMIILTRAVALTSPVLVTLSMSLQVVFLLIAQYTVLADIQPTIGNWIEVTGAVLVVLAAFFTPCWQVIRSKLGVFTKKGQDYVNREDIVTHL